MTFLACCRIAYLEDAGDIRRVCSPAAARRLTKKQLRSFLKKSQFKHISSDHQNKKISITAVVKTLSLKSSAKGSKMRQASSEAIEPASAEQKIPAQVFTFREMAIATNNFSVDNLVGEGGFGRVYKGCIPGVDKIVAVKQLDKNGLQGNREFLSEVFMLSMVSHTNLVNLIGYCADGDQRILVYEYMANGCLEDHLLDLPSNKKPLDWYTRMKIAYGAAKGLEYLHGHTNPPVIYRDFKASNILLNEEFNPRLSDFGLARIGPTGEKDHVSTRVMGTYGYCAPEYAKTGQLTTKSDVYSFGVVFLELICGRRVIDTAKPTAEQNLITWAKPLFKDKKLYKQMADPLLEEKYPEKGLYQAVAVAAMCLQEEASTRPLISDVLIALEFLLVPKPTDDQGSPRGIIVKAPVEDNPDEEKKHAEEDDEETKAEEDDEEKKFEDEDEDKNV